MIWLDAATSGAGTEAGGEQRGDLITSFTRNAVNLISPAPKLPEPYYLLLQGRKGTPGLEPYPFIARQRARLCVKSLCNVIIIPPTSFPESALSLCTCLRGYSCGACQSVRAPLNVIFKRGIYHAAERLYRRRLGDGFWRNSGKRGNKKHII